MNLDKYFNFHQPINNKQLLKKIVEEYSHVLYMRAGFKSDEHIFSTKFYDYLLMKKPIVYIGKEGDVSNFIRTEKVGLVLKDYQNNIDNFIDDSHDLKAELEKKDFSSYSIDNTISKLINILEID